ncbi:MAG: phosphate signaling complex protein PhoU [Planctomycetia bacterium]|nr:phosphate signaling complex protein PhoU [Planctomycetia bacterium]
MNRKTGDVPGEGQPTPGGHPHRQQEVLWGEVLSLAAYVEAALKTAVQALCRGRFDLIAQVRAEEKEIDRWEVRIETECLRVLALYGLVASDLRRVVAALRVNRDLEGMADLAENLAKRAKKLGRQPAAAVFLPRLGQLADEALAVVDDSLKALRTLDADLARRVILSDNAVDRHRAAVLAELKDAVRAEPEQVNTWLRLISSARNLERAADHATNIAEAVVYVKEGVLLRRGDGDGRGD